MKKNVSQKMRQEGISGSSPQPCCPRRWLHEWLSGHKEVTGIWCWQGDVLGRGLSSSTTPGHQGHVQFVDGMWFPQNSSLTLTFILLRWEMIGGKRPLSLGRAWKERLEISAPW